LGYQISAGERQRIGLARLLLTNPELLILDEPFAAQDYASKEKIKEIVKNLNSEKKITIVCISHELNILKNLADRIVVMLAGKVVEISDSAHFFSRPRHPYSKYLIEADEYKLTANPKKLNDNTEMKICGFFSRCDRSSSLCKEKLEKHEDDYSITYCNHPY
jgi:ABC-type dipeptide/oligopeptide/nickel transport system ATPase component